MSGLYGCDIAYASTKSLLCVVTEATHCIVTDGAKILLEISHPTLFGLAWDSLEHDGFAKKDWRPCHMDV